MRKFALPSLLLLTSAAFAQDTNPANQCVPLQKKPVVTFILPDQNAPFWKDLVLLAKAANQQFQLDVRFHALHPTERDRFNYDQIIDNILSKDGKTDFLVAPFLAKTEQKILDVAAKHQVKLLTYNSPLSARVIAKVGEPRKPSAHWLAHISPDDEQAGYDMAEQLLAQKGESSDSFDILAISGSNDSDVAEMRNAGLLRKLQEDTNVRLLQLVSTDWTYHQSRTKFKILAKRFAHIDAFWAASDEIAVSILDELQQNQSGIPTNLNIVSIDWSPRIVPYLQHNQLMSSYGGHVFEGAWLLALIYDYAHQQDFYPLTGAVIQYRLQGLQVKDATLLSNFVDANIDYRKLSQCLAKSFSGYDFNGLELLKTGIQARSTAKSQ